MESFEGVGHPDGSFACRNLDLALDDRSSRTPFESLTDKAMPVSALAGESEEQLSPGHLP